MGDSYDSTLTTRPNPDEISEIVLGSLYNANITALRVASLDTFGQKIN